MTLGTTASGDRRGQVLELIRDQPGLTVADIQRLTGLARGVVRYHLQTLSASGDVEEHRDGRKLRHFVPGLLPTHDRESLTILRHHRARQTLLTVALEPGIPFSSLALRMEVADSTLSDIAGRLEGMGLLTRIRTHGISYYRVTDLPLLHRLLTVIQPSLLDRLVDQFLDTWSD